MYQLYFTPLFERRLKKLVKHNPGLNKKIRNKIRLLIKNPNAKSLKLHKLSGQNVWSVSVAPDLRIILSIKNGVILCLNIGSHDDV